MEAVATSENIALPFATPRTYGAVLGTPFRLGPSMIVTLDWLVGGVESASPLQTSWQASLSYCLVVILRDCLHVGLVAQSVFRSTAASAWTQGRS